jgi:hypothetical protein
MDQFPLITSLQERDRKKKAAAAKELKGQNPNAGDANAGEAGEKGMGQNKVKGETMLGKMGKAFDKYAENASEHYEDKGMRMKPHWL